MKSEFDAAKFATMIRSKRGGKSLRAVAKEIGNISAPTLTRVEQGKLPDFDTFLNLCNWLQVSTETFMIQKEANTTEEVENIEASMVDSIEVQLRAEKVIDKDTINAIKTMVELAIQAARNGMLKK